METKKIVLVGETNVGKSSFVRKLEGKEILNDHVPTLGVEVIPIRRSLSQYVHKVFNIWDCAGDQRFEGLRDGYWVQADGAIIMVDCENSKTILTIEIWRTQLQRMIENKPIVVVLNKCEILTQAQRGALENALPDVVFISCRNNINIEEVLNKF